MSADYGTLLARGGDFGYHLTTSDDFDDAQSACIADYQHTLTLASVPSANMMVVCIRLPTVKLAKLQHHRRDVFATDVVSDQYLVHT